MTDLVQTGPFRTSGTVPENADFFQDHFPEFPVLPGVLMLDILQKAAEDFLRKVVGLKGRLRLARISRVKFSAFLKPGQAWESQVEWIATALGDFHFRASLSHSSRQVARAEFVLHESEN